MYQGEGKATMNKLSKRNRAVLGWVAWAAAGCDNGRYRAELVAWGIVPE